MLADTQPSCVGGLHNEFIYSGRLDNQMSAYCSIQVINQQRKQTSLFTVLVLPFQGLVSSLDTLSEETFIRGALLYDNEEVNECSLPTKIVYDNHPI